MSTINTPKHIDVSKEEVSKLIREAVFKMHPELADEEFEIELFSHGGYSPEYIWARATVVT